MWRYEAVAEAVAREADLGSLAVCYTDDVGWKFEACYQRTSRQLIVNAGRLGEGFFSDRRRQLALLIHELAHHFGDHLEERYDDGLARLGAAAVEVALREPGLFHSLGVPPVG